MDNIEFEYAGCVVMALVGLGVGAGVSGGGGTCVGATVIRGRAPGVLVGDTVEGDTGTGPV